MLPVIFDVQDMQIHQLIDRERNGVQWLLYHIFRGRDFRVSATRYLVTSMFTDMLPSNVLGGNFALVGLPSTGASGAIFGTLAVDKILTFTAFNTQRLLHRSHG